MLLSRIITFLKEARAELKRVTWPSREKSFRLTGAVLTVVVAVALLVAAVDYLFNAAVEALVAQ
jgi:preprotein translocase subunit SecE